MAQSISRSQVLSVALVVISISAAVASAGAALEANRLTKEANRLLLEANRLNADAQTPRLTASYAFRSMSWDKWHASPCLDSEGQYWWKIDFIDYVDLTNMGGRATSWTSMDFTVESGPSWGDLQLSWISPTSAQHETWVAENPNPSAYYHQGDTVAAAGPPLALEPGLARRIALLGRVTFAVPRTVSPEEILQWAHQDYQARLDFYAADRTKATVRVDIPLPWASWPEGVILPKLESCEVKG